MYKRNILTNQVQQIESNSLLSIEVVKKIDNYNLLKEFLNKYSLAQSNEPYNIGYARISNPSLPYGVYSPTKRTCYTYLPQYIRLNEQYKRFEQAEGLDQEEISRAYYNLIPLSKILSRFGFNFSKVITRFPRSYSLRVQNPILEALIT